MAPLPIAMVMAGGAANLPEPSAPAAPAAIDPRALAAPPSEFAARFERARRDPDHAAAMATDVAAPGLGSETFVPLGFGALGVVFMLTWVSHAPGGMALFGVVFLAVWLGLVWKMAGPALRRFAAPVEKRLAVVRTRSNHIRTTSTRDDDSAQVTTRTEVEQRAVLELDDGRRLALGGRDDVMGTLVERELGVAYIKGDHLIGFRRLAG